MMLLIPSQGFHLDRWAQYRLYACTYTVSMPYILRLSFNAKRNFLFIPLQHTCPSYIYRTFQVVRIASHDVNSLSTFPRSSRQTCTNSPISVDILNPFILQLLSPSRSNSHVRRKSHRYRSPAAINRLH